MERSAENYNYLIQKIDDFIRKYYLNKIIKGFIFVASFILAAYLVIAFTEYYGHYDPLVRTILFYAFIGCNIFVLTTYILIPLLAYLKLGKTINHEQASEIIGNHFQPVKDKLLNTLQLKRLSDLNPAQKILIDASISQKISELRPVPFSSAIHLRENRRYLKFALLPFSVLVIVFFSAPSILSDSTERLLKHKQHFVKKAPFSFVILNRSLSALQGDDYTLQVKLTGNEIPADLYLEDGVNTFKLNKENTVRFNYTFKNLQQNKEIRLKGGEFNSAVYSIEVKKKPSLLHFEVYLKYPAYLNKKDERLQNSGDLTLPQGTAVTWKIKAQDSDQMKVKINSRTILLNPSDKDNFTFAYKAMANTSYSVKPISKSVTAADSVSYQIRVIPDNAPQIQVNERKDSVNNNVLYFVGQVNDDHGFSKLNFFYRITNESGSEKKFLRSLNFDKNGLQSNFFHVWNVDEAKAEPGDQIEYYFEIYDNDGVHGPKATRSAVKTFRKATEKEVQKQIDSSTEQIKQKTEQAVKKASQIEREAKRLNQDLYNKKNLSFEEKKQIESLLEKQKELERLVKEIQNENKQNLFEQRLNREQDEKILQKQKQIEELFNNVLDEKTKEILRNIEKLLDQNNKKLTQEELSKMQLDNKSLQKELDRILELYKQLDFDQKLTQAIDKLDELSNKQQDLSEKSSQKNADPAKLNKEQEVLQKEFKDLKDQLDELKKKNQQLEQPNEFQNTQDEQEQIDKQQEQSSDNLEKKELQKAAANQKKAALQMQQLSKKLESMQQESEEKENEVNARNLREILDNLLTTSFDQENTMKSLQGMSINDPSYTAQAQEQKNIQGNLKMIEDSLYSLSRKVPQIQSVVNKEVQIINFNVAKAIENLGDRRTAEANRNQQFAMTSINNLALMLSEALEQLQQAQQNGKAGGKGKKKQSLSQLSKMQEQLNKNMQKAREQMQQQGQKTPGQQGKGASAMSEQLAKMAREQQMIRQAMQEINRTDNKDGKGSLGNLEKIMKEMEQTETDLVNKRIQQETLNRQQEILSKLLDAEKADREREQEEKRESKSGVEFTPNYSIILQEFQKIKQSETDLLKTVPPSLNLFYRKKVGDYFKFLNSAYK